jgi:hypothetical protein
MKKWFKETPTNEIAGPTGGTDRPLRWEGFGCALLAPEITESILEGSQPQDLNFEKLCEQVPSSWAEQREYFGFPPQSEGCARSLGEHPEERECQRTDDNKLCDTNPIPSFMRC